MNHTEAFTSVMSQWVPLGTPGSPSSTERAHDLLKEMNSCGACLAKKWMGRVPAQVKVCAVNRATPEADA